MSLRLALLGLIAEQPMSGYELSKRFAGPAHVWSAKHSQIYPELARLLQAGLIRHAESGPRGRKTYQITEAGLETVRPIAGLTVTPTPAPLDVSAIRFGFRYICTSVVSCWRQPAFPGKSKLIPWWNIWLARAIFPGSMPARVKGDPAATEKVFGWMRRYCPARSSTRPVFQRSLKPLKRTSSSQRNRELSA